MSEPPSSPSSTLYNQIQDICLKRKPKYRHTPEDIQNIHRALSVRIDLAPSATRAPLEISDIEDGRHAAKNPEPTSTGMELCWEFCWCFQCFGYIPHCVRYTNQCAQYQCQGISVYEYIRKTLYEPLFENGQIKTTKTQQLLLLIRICFELYKTMIGSFLTVFTPQRCSDGICTLTENLIPKDNMEIVALTMNTFMAFALIGEYGIEISRERILRMYFENDQRLPVEKEYFTNLLGILDTKKASLLGEQSRIISVLFRMYRRVGIILLSLYVMNVGISAGVIYKNYYDRSSLFGFITNSLFIVFKMGSILKIAIHSINMPYSAYIETPVAFNSIKPEYIKKSVKKHYLFGLPADTQDDYIKFFDENKQYMRFLLDGFRAPLLADTESSMSDSRRNQPNMKYIQDIESVHVALSCTSTDDIVLRHRNSFG